MNEHYKQVHNVALVYESLEFASKQKFDEWRIEIQRNTASQFAVRMVWKSSTGCNWRMQCHRTGKQPEEKDCRERFQKLSGSKKLNGFCPAEIVLHENSEDKTCRAVIQKTHVGHSNNSCEELKFLSLDKIEKSDIAAKLSVGVPINTILMNYQSSTAGQQLERNEIINYDDIANIAAALGLNTKY